MEVLIYQKMISKLFMMSFVVFLVNAAVWRTSTLPEKPEYLQDKEGCYIKEILGVISFGECITPIGTCHRICCKTTHVEYASCGAIGTNDTRCYIAPENNALPYPNCCPTVICDFINDIEPCIE